MSDKEYIKELEGRHAELIDTLDKHTLILDILKAKVNIVNSNFFKMIHPKQMCAYLEKLGWSVKYEKTHERFITRCYLSPHKDAKVKVFMQDLYGDKPTSMSAGMEGIPAKNKEIVSLLARIHKKGELEVIYEILSGKC